MFIYLFMQVIISFKAEQDVFAEVEISDDHLVRGKKVLVQKYHTSVSRTKPKHVVEVGLMATSANKDRKKCKANNWGSDDDGDTLVEGSDSSDACC